MFLEEILEDKEPLGPKYNFASNSLLMKPNGAGVRSLFSNIHFPKGHDILSLELCGGTLTQLRAYEEALPILSKLGAKRFNLPSNFVQAAALYLRYERASSDRDSILFNGQDIIDEYASSPVKCIGTVPYTKLHK